MRLCLPCHSASCCSRAALVVGERAEESKDVTWFGRGQVRDAYRKRGWAFVNMENIAQCKEEQFLVKVQVRRRRLTLTQTQTLT